MERQVARYSYWIGLLCVGLSVLWRIGVTLISAIPGRVGELVYSSFWKAGAVFLLISVASIQYVWLQERNAEKSTEKKMGQAA